MAFFNEFPHTRNYDADLGWLIKHVKNLIECCNSVTEVIDELKKFMDDIKKGDFPPEVIDAFEKWMERNLVDIIGRLVKNVYFGLTMDGYFVAYIPESWDDIIFNTTEYDIKIPNFNVFGHLVLSY